MKLIALPNIASKRWIYTQYDGMVGAANTSTNAPSDAAVILAKGTGKALAMTVDCNSRYVFADPYKGGMIAVAEAARNIVCSGGEPIGVTNCLNFGNPYDPEVYYQFVKAVTGMGDACRAFETPVTGGNVSFYNQNPDGPVYPTPTIGMVGIVEDLDNRMTLDFKNAGDTIILLGEIVECVGSSEYLHKLHKVEFSPAPNFDLEKELAVQKLSAKLIAGKNIASAHDISEGGLAITLLESCFNRDLGFDVKAEYKIRHDAFWFGEAQGRIVVSTENADAVLKLAKEAGVSATVIGKVTAGAIKMNGEDWNNIQLWKSTYDTSLEKQLN
jgi:phosphoribosylformylglycinamidine synthase